MDKKRFIGTRYMHKVYYSSGWKIVVE